MAVGRSIMANWRWSRAWKPPTRRRIHRQRVLSIWCRTAWACVTFMLLLAALVDWKTLLSTAPDPPNVANAGIYRHSYVQRDTAVWLTSDTVSVWQVWLLPWYCTVTTFLASPSLLMWLAVHVYWLFCRYMILCNIGLVELFSWKLTGPVGY